MTHPVIEFDHVAFSYDENATVFSDLTFSVSAGEAVTLRGPNGSGKSTALRLIVGLDFASKGTVRVFSNNVTRQTMKDEVFRKRLHQRVGLVFQDPECMLFNPTVEREIAFGPAQMGLSDQEVGQRVSDCLALFDLEHLKDRAPWRLSGGEKRRCAIACVVSMAPDVLLLDEPTNDLDEGSREQLVSFLRDFNKAGKTIVVSTHEAGLTEELGARSVSF